MIKLELLYHSRTLPHKSDFQRWINAVLRITPTQENALCIVFVDNEASAALNLQIQCSACFIVDKDDTQRVFLSGRDAQYRIYPPLKVRFVRKCAGVIQ